MSPVKDVTVDAREVVLCRATWAEIHYGKSANEQRLILFFGPRDTEVGHLFEGNFVYFVVQDATDSFEGFAGLDFAHESVLVDDFGQGNDFL